MGGIKILLVSLLSFIFYYGLSQNSVIKGTIYDFESKPAQFVNIGVVGTLFGTASDKNGKFELTVPANTDLKIVITYLGHKEYNLELNLKEGEISEQNIQLEHLSTMLPKVDIVDNSDRHNGMVRIEPKISLFIPSPGGFEDILKSLPQVSTNNELSSQYNVRGGNFDENMVFVNDVEIYRPILIRSGQQEGLSFINSDMVSSVVFSAGGFESKYGDKMSSVLDIKYRKPREFNGTVSASLLGTNMHVEGTSKNNLFKYNTGFRYKTTRYLLSSLDMAGKYDPNYLDFQTFLTYDLSDKIELAFLGNISNNQYKFIPKTQKTTGGTMNDVVELKIYFEGQEIDRFTSLTGAFTTLYKHNENTNFKFLLSSYFDNEEETFDIIGEYYLNELNSQMGSNQVGDSVVNIGVGKYHNHARNYLDGKIYTFKHIGDYRKSNHNLLWGVQYSYEMFDYRINEWTMIDSAGYSLPRSENNILLYYVDNGNVKLNNSRINAYIQDSYNFKFEKYEFSLGGGIRLNYWDFNNELLVSPRLNMGLKPEWEKNIVFRFSTGLYHQPPSLKEVRKLDGTLNKNIKAQSSYHIVLGGDYEFKMWDRPFKLVTEVFYKYLYNLNPYSVDNVRIKYYGENIAAGYAAGVEAKINGEFVKGTESWFSIAIMQTQEKIENAFYCSRNQDGILDTIYYGYVPRPTDQRVNLGIFFQDYIPNYPTWQVSLNLLFGTKLPFSTLKENRQLTIGRSSAYRRVDLGISKRLLSSEDSMPRTNVFKYFKEIWISLDVFNLLDINNTISYTWVTTTEGGQRAMPNYLTSRRINLKLIAKF